MAFSLRSLASAAKKHVDMLQVKHNLWPEREHAMDRLAARKDPTLAPFFLRMTTNAQHEIRNAAYSALIQLDHPDAVKPIVRYLSDSNMNLSFLALEVLQKVKDNIQKREEYANHPTAVALDAAWPFLLALRQRDYRYRGVPQYQHPNIVHAALTPLLQKRAENPRDAARRVFQLAHKRKDTLITDSPQFIRTALRTALDPRHAHKLDNPAYVKLMRAQANQAAERERAK